MTEGETQGAGAPPHPLGPEGLALRPFEDGDAEALSAMIARCLREANARDYPADTIERVVAHFSPPTLRRLAQGRETLAATLGGRPVGTASLEDGHRVFAVFVDQGLAGRGVGTALMHALERRAWGLGHPFVELGSSLTARGFYERRGYTAVRETDTAFGLNVVMRKAAPEGAPRDA